jgi:hypothetical protein
MFIVTVPVSDKINRPAEIPSQYGTLAELCRLRLPAASSLETRTL